VPSWSGSAGLPFRKIDGIQGRTEDILRLPGVSGDEVAAHPITFHHMLDSLPVSGWQVVQEADGLRVLLSGAQDEVKDTLIVDTLTRSLAAQKVIAPPVSVQHVVTIPKNPACKAPLIRLITLNEEECDETPTLVGRRSAGNTRADSGPLALRADPDRRVCRAALLWCPH
jgi:hypothetical protein